MPASMISLLISTSFAELEKERKRGGRGVTKRVDVLLRQKKKKKKSFHIKNGKDGGVTETPAVSLFLSIRGC